MTWEQYWYGEPSMIHAFRAADRMRQERVDSEAWLMGMYVYEAVGRAVGSLVPALNPYASKARMDPLPYIEEPYTVTLNKEREAEKERQRGLRKQKTEEQEDKEALRAKVYMMQMLEAGKNWGKR